MLEQCHGCHCVNANTVVTMSCHDGGVLQVPLERVRVLAAERPILLASSAKVIKEAAAKVVK